MKNKHLIYEERHLIEDMLANGYSLTKIAAHLNRNISTISKEIRKHRFLRNTGITRTVNGISEDIHCNLLERPPYVCNGCKKKRICKSEITLYHAARAQKEYEVNLRESREGTPLNKESFYTLDAIVSNAMKHG